MNWLRAALAFCLAVSTWVVEIDHYHWGLTPQVNQAIAQMSGGGMFPGPGTVHSTGGGGGCSDATTYLARGSFDAGHTTALTDFICGLNTDGIGIFTNAWDLLVVTGNQNSTVAILNLPSTGSTFSPTPTGSPTFTADRGYTGVDASATVYLDTNYNANTQATNYAQNSAHISIWSIDNPTSGVSGGSCMGSGSSTTGTRIFPKYNDTKTYADINTASTGSMVSAANAAGPGQFVVDRTTTTETTYYNGTSLMTATSNTSVGPINDDFTVLANDVIGGGPFTFGCGNTIAMYSTGRHLTSTEVSNFYSRSRTLGTALGWP